MTPDRELEERKVQYQRILRASPALSAAAEQGEDAGADPMALAGQYVLGPALGAFVQWLLVQTAAAGQRRLYFLARDGYFFFHAARLLSRAAGLPVDCRYLSCSRYSLRLPLFHRDLAAAFDAVCRPSLRMTLDAILARAGLSPAERQAVQPELGLPFSLGSRIYTGDLPAIRLALARSPSFTRFLDARSRDALPGLAGYLKQEGLLEPEPAAVVDSGWVGSIQKTLNQVLFQLGQTQGLEGYYWGLYDLPPDQDPDRYHSYSFGPKGFWRRKAHFNNCLFEAVFTAPHGMTLSYREEGGRFFPCYGQISPEREAFVRRMEEILLSYIRRLAGHQPLGGPEGIKRDCRTVNRLLELFLSSPTRREAECFGGLAFSDDALEGGEEAIAAPLTVQELQEGHLLPKLLEKRGLRPSGRRESAWYPGSAVLYGGRRAGRHLRRYAAGQYLRYVYQDYARRRKGRRDS